MSEAQRFLDMSSDFIFTFKTVGREVEAVFIGFLFIFWARLIVSRMHTLYGC